MRSIRKFVTLSIRIISVPEQILTEHREKLDIMADALMKYETIDEGQLKDIMAGQTAEAHRKTGTVRMIRRVPVVTRKTSNARKRTIHRSADPLEQH